MAKGSTLHGKWGNGAPRQSVTRTGFVESTISTPKAKELPPERAPLLLQLSEPWYETPSRVNRIRANPLGRSQTGGATTDDEPLRESRPRNEAPRTKIPTLPPFK